jgi:hypothetical protein
MPSVQSHDDEDWYDDEDTGSDDAAPCPECGTAIYDDLDHCPQCGYWITDADHRSLDRGHYPTRRVRIVAVVILVIFVIALLASGWSAF